MITSIALCSEHRRRIDGRKTIRFKSGLNVVVGPNGSGKSSLLEAIYSCRECKKNQDKNRYRYFNSETMNPHQSSRYFRGVEGSLIRVRAMFSSHGETMRDVLRFTKIRERDCWLLDEPEAGHDLRWIIKIHQALQAISKKDCQIIAASHHPVIWEDAKIIELKRGYFKETLHRLISRSRLLSKT